MTREEVWEKVAETLRVEFGRLLSVRDVRRVRRAAGEGWKVTVALAAPSGDLHVADLLVEQTGAITPALDGDAVIAAVKRAAAVRTDQAPASVEGDMGDLSDFDEGADDLGALDALTEEPVDARIQRAFAKGTPEGLNEARELLPRLLADHEKRGATLLRMAEVEIALDERGLAKGYLEAAAREFGDRFEIVSLENAAALAMKLLGKFDFVGSPIHMLLEESRARLRPIQDMYECRSLAGISPDVRALLEPHVTLRTLAPGETLVEENSPSENVFVVKSGLLGVWLEKPAGGQWLVRCCFPGWLLGESSVLYTENPRCTATLKAERIAEVWVIPGAAVKEAMRLVPAFAERMAATKQIHRIDSFFSMHETMSQLDVQVRDAVLSCIVRLEMFEQDTVLVGANDIPPSACLVARGAITLSEPGKPPASTIGPDEFFGVRDSMHQICCGLEAVAKAGSTIAFFDADRLRKVCLESPEHVVAILERLG